MRVKINRSSNYGLLDDEDDDNDDELLEQELLEHELLDEDENDTVKYGLVGLLAMSFNPSALNDRVAHSSLIKLNEPFGVIQALWNTHV